MDTDLSRDQASHPVISSSGLAGIYYTSSEGQNTAIDIATLSTTRMSRAAPRTGGYHERDPVATSTALDSMAATSYSAPASPKTVPPAPGASSEESDKISGAAVEEAEAEEEQLEETTSLTAEELRRQKRKTKRFRYSSDSE